SNLSTHAVVPAQSPRLAGLLDRLLRRLQLRGLGVVRLPPTQRRRIRRGVGSWPGSAVPGQATAAYCDVTESALAKAVPSLSSAISLGLFQSVAGEIGRASWRERSAV